MNELRWILIGIGLVLLALIYLFSRRTPEDDSALPPADRHSTEGRFEPPLTRDDEESQHEAVGIIPAAGQADQIMAPPSGRFAPAREEPLQVSSAESAPEEPAESATQLPSGSQESAAPQPSPETTSTPVLPEKVIALHLMPKAGEVFEGLDFVGAIQAEGLKFGRFDIFHRYSEPESATEETPALFSVANMIKPGTFNLHDLEGQQFKGASMFLVLPGPPDAVAAFADMLATGRRLAVTMNGQLLDSHGTQLSRQSASHLREDIINYQHGISATPTE